MDPERFYDELFKSREFQWRLWVRNAPVEELMAVLHLLSFFMVARAKLAIYRQIFMKMKRIIDKVLELSELLQNLLRMCMLIHDDANRRGFKLMCDVLGSRVATELLRTGRVRFLSYNGKEYTIDLHGTVYDSNGSVCVHVDGEEELPPFDVVLAKYLVMRDRPDIVMNSFEFDEPDEGNECDGYYAGLSQEDMRVLRWIRRRRMAAISFFEERMMR